MLPISVCRFARRRSCPGVSPQRFDSPWHARLFIGESWHTSPGDHIPAGRLFNCQGACPSLAPTGKGILLGCFLEVFIIPFTCSDWEARFGGVFLKGFLTLPLVRTEIPVFFGCFEKFLPLYLFPLGKAVWGGVLKNYLTPSLVPTGKPVLVGCSRGKYLPLLVWNEKTVLVMLFLKVFYYPLICSH